MPEREPFRALSAGPLAAAYLMPPLLAVGSRFMQTTMPLDAAMDYTWLAVAALALLLSLFMGPLARRRRDSMARLNLPAFLTVWMVVAAVLLYRYGIPLVEEQAWLWPYLQEARFPAYALFAIAWSVTLGVPARKAFIKTGGVLGFMVCADLALRLFLPGLPPISGLDNDIMATLLLLSLCAGFGLSDDDTDALRVITMLGILATLSRPALFAAMWATLFFGSGKWYQRAPYSLVCLITLAATILSAHPIFDIAPKITDYWMWLEGVKLMLEDPAAMLMGFPLDQPLPGKIPFGMMYLWKQATGVSAMEGAFVFQATPMWLRLGLAWGLAAPIALLTTLLVLVGTARNRFMAGLATCIAAQGLLVGLTHNPVTAVPLWLAVFCAVSQGPDPKPTTTT
ncbi:hypothetical protein [Salidesulfovibrio brasiliensis]|uniref:hypothetical protein n=1 Tax=Salidesulfovibrio brasiliensis TaxID=221711 RepID=UPI0006D03052|nr:hypothetical protein [Salidesulfovibrio brasiliensis]